jgi:hypothetical protein
LKVLLLPVEGMRSMPYCNVKEEFEVEQFDLKFNEALVVWLVVERALGRYIFEHTLRESQEMAILSIILENTLPVCKLEELIYELVLDCHHHSVFQSSWGLTERGLRAKFKGVLRVFSVDEFEIVLVFDTDQLI